MDRLAEEMGGVKLDQEDTTGESNTLETREQDTSQPDSNRQYTKPQITNRPCKVTEVSERTGASKKAIPHAYIPPQRRFKEHSWGAAIPTLPDSPGIAQSNTGTPTPSIRLFHIHSQVY